MSSILRDCSSIYNYGASRMKFTRAIFLLVLTVLLAACAGSVARTALLGYGSLLAETHDRSNEKICRGLIRFDDLAKKYENEGVWQSHKRNVHRAATEVFESRGLDSRYCEDPQKYTYLSKVDVEVYNIDTLRVTTEKLRTDVCSSGGIHKILLEGTISPDSSFAMEKLLKRSPHCRDKRGHVIVATTVQLESGGGYLVDGYKLGRSLRKAGATTVIENKQGCASSCAVAFLGGKKRVVEDTGGIMFHAPYFSGKNAYGEKVIDCDIPKPDLQKLNDYYVEMVGREAGDRLYERTMWYCSSEDGWVVSGGSAAELFDIATEK